ncbi:MAG: AIR synthase-related protein, partial [Gammaproteobacteria bacterium]|nr:AIR synthase-related protein [Gammaproteobacteria bacterium]
LFEQVDVHALAHITGGGLPENLPRVLPEGTRAIIDSKSWDRPAVFNWLQEQGNIADSEMYRTFNCGIGMVLAISAADSDRALDVLRAEGESPVVIGTIESGAKTTEVIIN